MCIKYDKNSIFQNRPYTVSEAKRKYILPSAAEQSFPITAFPESPSLARTMKAAHFCIFRATTLTDGKGGRFALPS